MRSPRFLTAWILASAAIVLAGCTQNETENSIDPADLGPPPAAHADNVIEPVPQTPTPPDESEPGVYMALAGVEPPVRQFVVEPETSNGRGILLAHTQWGIDGETRGLARRLAESGYVVVVPDYYEGVVSTTNLSALHLLQGVGRERAAELTQAALAHLRGDERVKAIGVLAVGTGAAWVTQGLNDVGDVGAVVFDSPMIADPDKATGIDAPVLMMTGVLSNAFPDFVIQSWTDAFEAKSATLVVERVEDAGTVLLDPHAIGFRMAPEIAAMEKLLEFFDARLG